MSCPGFGLIILGVRSLSPPPSDFFLPASTVLSHPQFSHKKRRMLSYQVSTEVGPSTRSTKNSKKRKT